MPDTILINGFEDDEVEVITKFDLDDDELTEDELNESAEFYLDELIMDTADPQIPVYSMVRELDEIIPKKIPLSREANHVTADTIETMIGIEAELMHDDGSDLQFLMDTLTGKE
jgi:hypothetical protein